MEIRRPCPASLSNMTKSGDAYFCPGCSKSVIDFRDKSIEEIKEKLQLGGCGVFNSDQLTQQKRFGYFGRFAFRVLTVISFLGFTVKPMKAQTTIPLEHDTTTADTIQSYNGFVVEAPVDENEEKTDDTKQAKKKATRRRGLRKRKKYRVMGCPDF